MQKKTDYQCNYCNFKFSRVNARRCPNCGKEDTIIERSKTGAEDLLREVENL